MKAIFEPVNYGQDINLTDVFFTSPDEGWVSGEHATILHTADGGKTWTAQVGGDPSSGEKPIGQLRFLDARHGWAVTDDNRLLRTMDGENWEQIGDRLAPGSGFIDYSFTSVRHGIALGGNMGGFFVTNDGGRHWQNVGLCQITVRIQGLPQTQTCYFIKLQMLSANSGLAITSWRSPEAPNATTLAIFRTDNGGQSWSYVVPAFHEGGERDIFFTDLDHGVAVFDRKTYVTADGGRNWHALLSGGAETIDSRVRFADPETGWSIGGKYPSLALSYTTDGGQHWKTFAPLKLPGDPDAKTLSLSFPRRDRAYVVGPHGMIYRYRIVPADYSASNALPAPLVTGFDISQLTAAAMHVEQDITTLESQIATASGGTVSFSSGSSPNAGPQTAAAGTAQNTAGAFTQETGAATTPAADASASGPFTQDVVVGAARSPDSTGASPSQGFTQNVDTSAASAPLQSCCAATVQNLQTDLNAFNQAAPTATHLRPLNLFLAGLQVVTTILNQANQLRASFSSLKHAPSLQAAALSLQQLSGAIRASQQAITTGFQNPGAYFAATAPAGFTQDVGAPGSAGAATAVFGTSPSAAFGAAPAATGTMPAAVATAAPGAAPPQPGTPSAVLEGGTGQAFGAMTAQIVSANTNSQDLNTLAGDNTIVQALQQGAAGAAQQASSGLSSTAASSLSSAAGGLVGGLFKKRSPPVVYLWGLTNAAGSISVSTSNPALEINYASVPGVNPADYAPALIRLVPAQNGWFLVGAAKGPAGALQNSSANWEVYSSFNEQRVPAQVSQTSPGQARIQPAHVLPPGAYAVVLRPVSSSKKFSGADLAGLQGDGLIFNSAWVFIVNPGAPAQ